MSKIENLGENGKVGKIGEELKIEERLKIGDLKIGKNSWEKSQNELGKTKSREKKRKLGRIKSWGKNEIREEFEICGKIKKT